jgi:dCTP deaminase
MTSGPLSLFSGVERAKDVGAPLLSAAELGAQFGLLPREKIALMVRRKMIQGEAPIEECQFQPASLDLRLGHAPTGCGRVFCPAKTPWSRNGLPDFG